MKKTILAAQCILLLSTGISSAVNILTIDYDANPAGYTYGFEFFGYGSPNSGGNQAEGAWNAPNRASAFTRSGPTVTAGSGVGGSSGMVTTFDSSGLTTSANQDASERFGDANVSYTYWGAGLGAGGAPSTQITTTDPSQIVFSIDAAFQGVASAGDFFRVEISFKTGGAQDPDLLRYRAEFAIPANGGFTTLTGNFGSFDRRLGTDDLLDEAFTSVNIGIELVNAQSRFGIDSGNSVTIDNIVIEQIPEPTTPLLAALGLLSFSLRRRR